MSAYGGDTHWRNSMKPARFFFLDARAAVPFVIMLLHLRLWTMIVATLTTMAFYILEQRGMNFAAALRGLRVWFVGCKRPNIKTSDRHRTVDYAWEPWPEKFNDTPLEESDSPAPVDPRKAPNSGRKTAAPAKKVSRPGQTSPASGATPAGAAKSG
jgi:intracellular multiplication protein IcmT